MVSASLHMTRRVGSAGILPARAGILPGSIRDLRQGCRKRRAGSPCSRIILPSRSAWRRALDHYNIAAEDSRTLQLVDSWVQSPDQNSERCLDYARHDKTVAASF